MSNENGQKLAGKVAVVTGGSRGIGAVQEIFALAHHVYGVAGGEEGSVNALESWCD